MTEKLNPEQDPNYKGPLNADNNADVESDAESIFDEELEKTVEASGSVDSDKTSAQADEWKNRAAYLTAEIENMHKRFMREASEIRKFANEDLLRSLTPVLDNLILALQAAEKARVLPENEALYTNKVFMGIVQGVEMTAKQFEQTLASVGVEFITAAGQVFDPTVHEALGQTTREGVADNVVVEEYQKGFKVGGRVIRPSKVIVNKI